MSAPANGIAIDAAQTRSRETGAAIFLAGAHRLAAKPYATVTLEHVAADLGTTLTEVQAVFPSMHDLGAALLDHERASMRDAAARAARTTDNPLERLVAAFRFVGKALADDMVVRAGVRIAAESREHFPERRLDPFRTWEAFVVGCLSDAKSTGAIPSGLDVPATVWLIVAAGMGTKELLGFHDIWEEAPDRLAGTVRSVVSLVTSAMPPADQIGKTPWAPVNSRS